MPDVRTVGAGYWGDWQDFANVPDGYYIRGMRTRLEASQGSHGDDTALNGLELICRKWGTTDDIRVMVHEGFWGDWTQDVPLPENCYLIGLGLRIEPPQGDGDDTALNGIVMIGRNDGTGQVVKVVAQPGMWGQWLNDVSVEVGKQVAGIRVRIERPIGHGDDTAMNGIQILVSDVPANATTSPPPGGHP